MTINSIILMLMVMVMMVMVMMMMKMKMANYTIRANMKDNLPGKSEVHLQAAVLS